MPKCYKLSVIPLQCGTMQMHRSYFSGLTNDLILEFPIFSFLITHPRGLILFDTGLPSELWEDDSSMELISGLIAAPGNSGGLLQELEKHDCYPDMVSFFMNSHDHIDHTGGNNLIPGAHRILGNDAQVIADNGECDLFGDGSICLVATPGHSPDHKSMLVRGKKRQVLLTGDACFRSENIMDLEVPLILENRERAVKSLKRLRDICMENGTIVLTSHDPDAFGQPVIL
ncbi:MAG: N-acyl homoserine lactonase family protein [Syntrophomonas sp.]|nr:N-acyl homoserine lactonase family protein [Syntrophomonas sp.]